MYSRNKENLLKKTKKNIRLLCLIFFLAAMLQPFLAVKPEAAIATDTLTIKVGYQGGPFFTKATYHWRDLDDAYGGALTSHQVAYSYYGGSRDGGAGRNVVVSARGFYISDLLEYAGIDISSIAGFEFYTDDQKTGAFTTMTKKELLDNARYYYPNMGVDDEGKQIALDGGDITAGMTRVNSMFALEDNWEWDAVGSNFTSMRSTGRFHLLFGQENVTESRTRQAAKYVHTINVIFSGAPVIGTESNIELKVGTDHKVQVKITAADTELENYIRENLVWSSNNTDIVEVDQYGNLTIKGDGTAVISARSGDTAGSVSITAGNGAGAGSGGSPEQQPSEKPRETVETASPEQPSSRIENAVSFSEQSKGVYILSKDFMKKRENTEWVNSILNHAAPKDSETGSVMNRRKESMADDANQLVVPETPPIKLRYIGGVLLLVFTAGIAFGPLVYGFNKRGPGKPALKRRPEAADA